MSALIAVDCCQVRTTRSIFPLLERFGFSAGGASLVARSFASERCAVRNFLIKIVPWVRRLPTARSFRVHSFYTVIDANRILLLRRTSSTRGITSKTIVLHVWKQEVQSSNAIFGYEPANSSQQLTQQVLFPPVSIITLRPSSII